VAAEVAAVAKLDVDVHMGERQLRQEELGRVIAREVGREVEALGQLDAVDTHSLEQQRLEAKLAQVVAARAVRVGHRLLVGQLVALAVAIGCDSYRSR